MPLHQLVKSRFFVSFFVTSLLSVSLGAQSLPKPKGPVLLTVSGKITNHNAGDLAEFDADGSRRSEDGMAANIRHKIA